MLSFKFAYFQNKPLVVEPIDFESFILKNKTLIQNDPQRELLMYPTDDVTVNNNLSFLQLSIKLKNFICVSMICRKKFYPANYVQNRNQ